MEATRIRFGPILEWLIAAAVVTGALAAGSMLLREFRTVRAVMPVVAGAALAEDAPAGVPSRAVSVPMLLLQDGRAVRVGERASDVVGRLGNDVQVAGEALDRNGASERLLRFYEHFGTRFVLVFERSEGDPDQHVAAIYLH